MPVHDVSPSNIESPIGSPIVSVGWLRDQRHDPAVRVVDVRARDAYDREHITGAQHLDLSVNRLGSSSPIAIERWLDHLRQTIQQAGFTRDHHIIFYEDDSGAMAAYGVWLLDAAGLGNASMLDGGFLAWKHAGQLTSTEPVMPPPTSTEIHFNERVLATAGQILGDLADGARNARRVDARSDVEVAQGAIPGAAHLDWHHHLDQRGAFRPMPELARMYASMRLDTGDRIASYCAGGIRAANTYVVLKALGYTNVQNYAPSWGEWGSRSDTPIE